MAFIIALIISIIVCVYIDATYTTHAKLSAEEYTKSQDGENGVEFTVRRDEFIRTYTTKTPRNK